MREALAQGLFSKRSGDVPFGAVIVRRGVIVAAAGNSEHTDHDVTKHAEVKVISEASRILGTRDLSDCTLYSTVEPCTMCSGATFYACIKRLVFGMSRDDLPHLFRPRAVRVHNIAQDCNYTPEVISGVLRDEAVNAFLDYRSPFRLGSSENASRRKPKKAEKILLSRPLRAF